MITATRNGITRNFSEQQWKSMPKDKYGWEVQSETGTIKTNSGKVSPDEIIQKKIEQGKVVNPATKKEIPDELKPKVGKLADEITGNQDKPKTKRNVKRSKE